MQKEVPQQNNSLFAMSFVMLLCGIGNAVINILRRILHLVSAVTTAAEMKTDYSAVENWKDIAVSIYDLTVIFSLSFGIIAVLQLAAAGAGIIYSISHSVGKGRLRHRSVPFALGVICTVFGAISIVIMLLLHSTNVFLTIIIIVLQLVLPVIFTKKAHCFAGARPAEVPINQNQFAISADEGQRS